MEQLRARAVVQYPSSILLAINPRPALQHGPVGMSSLHNSTNIIELLVVLLQRPFAHVCFVDSLHGSTPE